MKVHEVVAMSNTVSNAINESLDEILKKDKRAVLLGEDLSTGGIFNISKGLYEKYGKSRIIDLPVGENTSLGIAIGMAMEGFHPIVEIMYADFLFLALDNIWMHLSQLPIVSKDKINLPVIIRVPYGSGNGDGYQHNASLYSLAFLIPNIFVFIPSNPYEFKQIFNIAHDLKKPSFIFEHRSLYNIEFKDENKKIKFGKADLVTEGNDISIVGAGLMVNVALKAIKKLKIKADLINPLSLNPLDLDTIALSVKKTKKLLIIDDELSLQSYGNYIISSLLSKYHLEFKAEILGYESLPLPYNIKKEKISMPNENKIIKIINKMLKN
ncbi:MAG: alpha-ketoacid dehydrogenase subunit beta [Thermoplasmata archaeon]